MTLRRSLSTDWNASDASHGAAGLAQSAAPVVVIDQTHSASLRKHTDEMRAEFADLMRAFGEWDGACKALLTDEREQYLRSVKNDAENIDGLKSQLAAAQATRHAVVAALQAEQREFDNATRANAELEAQRGKLNARLARVRDEAARLQESLAADETELALCEAQHAARLQRERLEASLCEEALGLRLETVGGDDGLIRLTWTSLDPRDPTRRFVLVLDTSTNRHRVVSCEPAIPQLARMLMTLDSPPMPGTTRGDFGAFCRSVRDAFLATVSAAQQTD